MPADAVPFLIAIAAVFGVFIVALGGAQIWTALPDRKSRSRD